MDRSKFVTPEVAARAVRSGDWVDYGFGAGFPELMDRALAEQILAQAKLLPKELYRTFVLYYGYELSVSEVAAALGVGKEAVKSRLFRARKQLKTACDGMNDRDRRIGGNENE